jgi:hypothetical protein
MAECEANVSALPYGVDEPEIYRRMRLTRRFDERVAEMRLVGRYEGVVHASVGQEAVSIGSCAHLRDGDKITSTHRGHGARYLRGCAGQRDEREQERRRQRSPDRRGGLQRHDDPSNAAACAQQAVSEHVAAMVGASSMENTSSVMDVLAQVGIPEIAPEVLRVKELTSDGSFVIPGGPAVDVRRVQPARTMRSESHDDS